MAFLLIATLLLELRAIVAVRSEGDLSDSASGPKKTVSFATVLHDGGGGDCLKPRGRPRPDYTDYMGSCAGQQWQGCPGDKPFLVYQGWHCCCVEQQPEMSQCCTHLWNVIQPAFQGQDMRNGIVKAQLRRFQQIKGKACGTDPELAAWRLEHRESLCQAMAGTWRHREQEAPDGHLSRWLITIKATAADTCNMQATITKLYLMRGPKEKGQTVLHDMEMTMQDVSPDFCGKDVESCWVVGQVVFDYMYSHNALGLFNTNKSRSLRLLLLSTDLIDGSSEYRLAVAEDIAQSTWTPKQASIFVKGDQSRSS